MGRKRLPEGTRYIDRYKTIILRVPADVYEKIEQQGKPSDVAAADLVEKYGQNDAGAEAPGISGENSGTGE